MGASGSPPSGVSCGQGQHEIAFVEAATKGRFQDTAYGSRALSEHVSICSNSKIIHVKDGKETADDQFVLRGIFGEKFERYRCGDNLNCNNPDFILKHIRDAVSRGLQGKSLWDSVDEFLQRCRSGQKATLPRGLETRGSGQGAPLSAAILTARTNVTAEVLFPFDVPANISSSTQFDLCQKANRVDCGRSLPRPQGLPFLAIPPGLHLIWEAKPLDGDTVPVRVDGSVAYILAADPSWTPEDLTDARRFWSAVVADPQFKAADLRPALAGLANKLAQPRP